MHYVYILILENGQIYTGKTDDLKRRFQEHKNGKVVSTKNRRPVKLIHYEAYLLKEDAQRREKFLKTSDGKLFLRRQLSLLFQKLGKK